MRSAAARCARLYDGALANSARGAGECSTFAPVLSALKSFLPRRRGRRAEFDADLCALIQGLLLGVRSGREPIRVMSELGVLFEPASRMGECLKALEAARGAGATDEELLGACARNMPSRHGKLLCQALLLSGRYGSSLGAPLERLLRSARERQSLERKVRTALAMHKLAAVGILGCSLVVLLTQFAANADALRAAWMHPVAGKVLVLGVTLMGLGAGLLVRMTRHSFEGD